MAKLESRKMGEQPVAKLLITMALPMMLSMLTQAFYNVVDSIYVARVSEDCLAALSMAFPVQNLLIGLGTGTAVGVGTLIPGHWVPGTTGGLTGWRGFSSF